MTEPILKRWFSFKQIKNERDQRMARILMAMIAVYWLGSLIVLGVSVYWDNSLLQIFLVLGCILQLLPLYFLRQGNLPASNFLITGIYILFTTLFATYGQGIHDYVLMAYPATVLFAGLTAKRRSMFFVTVLILLAILWLVLGEQRGWFVIYEIRPPDWTDLVSIMVLVLVSAFGVFLLVSDLQEGNAQINRELAERLRSESLLQLRLKILEAAEAHSLRALMQYALDEISEFVDSPVGFYHLMENDQRTISLQAWSTRTLKEFCQIEAQDRHYPVASAGVWADSVRQLKPIIHNDYNTLPGRKGLPEGHARVTRELVVPVFREERVKAILGVGNKSTDYTERDVQAVSYIADVIWEITERKRTEQLLQESNQQLVLRLKEIEQLQIELREQAIRDPLTGLYNRRYLAETLEREIARAEREKDYLSIIISDVDHFKTINDTHGHQVGDQFLMQISTVMKSSARGSDIICRYGGEEFLLVIAGCSHETAYQRANEIRKKCAGLVIEHDNRPLRVTMSFGVATYPTHGQAAEQVIIRADQALYRSKETGRNRVTIWNASMSRFN